LGLTPFSGADGDGDGSIDADDYGVWKSHFGETLQPGAGSVEGDRETGRQGGGDRPARPRCDSPGRRPGCWSRFQSKPCKGGIQIRGRICIAPFQG
jgi:hypothetical protein